MTATITPLALNRHSSCFRLTDFIYKTLRNFHLLSRCPTRRVCRGGRTRLRWGNSLYSNLALINARSINRKSELINDFISSSSIDVLAVTESWLSGDDGDKDLRAMCPAGYSFVHRSRGSRGFGIALIFNSMMSAQRLPSPALHSTFESLDVLLVFRRFRLRLVVINSSSSIPAKKFLTMMESYGFHQYVTGPTHDKGHTLDLLFARPDDGLISCASVTSGSVTIMLWSVV
ncbi:hypothetical protein DAPPUDRAFT_104992 [Daphnia pulex]|uniref:Endonuclease/exonuclease/phosphatase domain-containing protein n=1 Tax=Daphnia pulex TaxID=6669 RepID=E9GP17_DAPPU|nr:hypothetical protein DAPPUDRAFT_104992 [Daphnia pulex]|eukprot:EFX78763.1 hypothetical protein DAPPUDRAFT_104992 [Daphnia pulex]